MTLGLSIDVFPAVVSIAVIPLAFTALAAAPALVFIGLTLAMNRAGAQ